MELLAETGVDQLDQTFHGLLLVSAIGDDTNGGAADDAQRQDAQQALGVYATLLFLDPDEGLILIGLLDEESSGTGMLTDLIFNGNFLNKHSDSTPIFKCLAVRTNSMQIERIES